MWSRKLIKRKAIETLKKNYWKMVLMALLCALLTGSTNSGTQMRKTIENRDTVTESITGGSYDLKDYARAGIISRIFMDGVTTVVLVSVLLILMLSSLLAIVLLVFVVNPLIVGTNRFFYRNINEKASMGELTFSFENGYSNTILTMFLRDLFTFLWTLLLIIPGIIKSYEYRMIPYILAENPDMPKEQVFALSKRMMDGNKMDAFIFDLSFIGWFFLSALTINLSGIFFSYPYYFQACAMLYDAIKIDDKAKWENHNAQFGYDNF